MADDESQSDAPSLAPPSLTPPSIGLPKLRRRKKAAEASAPAVVETPTAVETPAPVETPAVVDPPAEPEAPAEAEAPAVVDAPVVIEAPAVVDAPAVVEPPAAVDTPAVVDPPAEADPPVDFEAAPADTTAPADAPAEVPEAEAGAKVARSFRVPGRVAAVATGLLIGLLMVVATSGAGRGCDRLSGPSGCSGGVGFGFLVLIVVLAIVVGGALLRLLRVSEPGSTSFLAVGLTTVVALLFFAHDLSSWWMVIVIPVVSMATYALSHWVTETFGDVPAGDAHR